MKLVSDEQVQWLECFNPEGKPLGGLYVQPGISRIKLNSNREFSELLELGYVSINDDNICSTTETGLLAIELRKAYDLTEKFNVSVLENLLSIRKKFSTDIEKQI